jgi:hypothetical protein
MRYAFPLPILKFGPNVNAQVMIDNRLAILPKSCILAVSDNSDGAVIVNSHLVIKLLLVDDIRFPGTN